MISSLYMVPTARRLARSFHVLAPDLPGFGLSSKPPRALTVPELAAALAAWARATGIDSAHWVGNSFGCQVISELAVQAPQLIRSVVMAGPTYDPGARRFLPQFGRWLIDWTRERPSLIPAHLRDYWKSGLSRAIRTVRISLAHAIHERLPLITAPALVVRGGRDPIVPQRWAEEAARLLPKGELVTIEGAPHVVNYTTPDAFARVVEGFVTGRGR